MKGYFDLMQGSKPFKKGLATSLAITIIDIIIYSGLLYSGLLLPHELAALLLPPALREYHYVEECTHPFGSDVTLTPLLKLGWGNPCGFPCKHEQLMTKQCGCSKIHGLLGERDGIEGNTQVLPPSYSNL